MPEDANCGMRFVDARNNLGNAIECVLGAQASDHPDTKFSRTLPAKIWFGFVYAPLVSILILIIIAVLYAQFVIGTVLAAVILFAACVLSLIMTSRYYAAESGELFRQLQDIMKQYLGSLESGRMIESQSNLSVKNITSGHSNVSIVAVYRDEYWQRIPSLLLVDGDIIALTAGDITPGKVFELISDRNSVGPPVAPPWSSFGGPMSPQPIAGPSLSANASMTSRRGWHKGQCLDGGIKIHLREERRKYAITPHDVMAAYSSALAAATADSTLQDSNPRPFDSVHKRSRGQSFDTQCRERRLNSDAISPNLGSRLRSGSHDSPLGTGSFAGGKQGHSDDKTIPTIDKQAAASGYAAADNTTDRHKHTRAINNQSSELLTLSGDMRCFVLAETPVKSFCRDVLSTSQSSHANSGPILNDSYVRALFVSVYDDSRSVMWWLVGLSLAAAAVRLALVPECRKHFIGMVSSSSRECVVVYV